VVPAALAAATAPRPSVLLADEPTDRLHPKDRAVVLRELAAINAEYGTTTVVVTHDPQVAAALPRTVTIRDGRIGGEGRSGEEFAVVTADHYLPVPEALHGRLSPGTLVHFVAAGDRIELVRPDPDRRPGRDVESDGAPGGSGSRGGVP
jgi:putative ABC transport system ATP-binding protein